MNHLLKSANWAAALVIAIGTIVMTLVLGSLGIYLDNGLNSAHGQEMAIATDLQDAQKQAVARERFELAASKACGPQAGWREQEDGSIRCTLHTGRATKTVIQVSAL
jgi:hypothetical protein